MRRVAVTGISGYIGSLLLGRLNAHPDVESVIGIDSRLPAEQPPKLRFYLRDVTKPLGDLLRQEQVDVAVHLAFVLLPPRDRKDARRVNVEGTRNFLEACVAAGVGHALYLGSAAAYGAHPDNPIPIPEEAPLRPNRGFAYAVDKAETDQVFREYAASNPGVPVTILRACPVLGPRGGGAATRLFQPVMLKVLGRNPAMQFLHEDDLMDLLMSLLERPVGGVFNVAADGFLRYTEVARVARRPMVAIAGPVLGGLLDVTWALRLQSQSASAGLAFIAHPWVVTNDKIKDTLGFRCRYSTEETVRAFVGAGPKQQR